MTGAVLRPSTSNCGETMKLSLSTNERSSLARKDGLSASAHRVGPSTTFVDIHCHVLPGLDDGASTMDEALAMAEMAVADGIGTIVATPHQLGSHADNTAEAIRTAVARFQQRLDERGVPLCVLPGADVRIDAELVQELRAGSVLTLADRGRHVLLELPHDVYVSLDHLLTELHTAGLVGILSHPERNRGLLNQPEIVRPLVQRGCLLQVTAGSLTGGFGTRVQRFAESLIQQGLVHFVSTDAHGTSCRPPVIRTAFEQIAKLAGQTVAMDLCCRNPAAVVAGGGVPSGPRPPEKTAWSSWFH